MKMLRKNVGIFRVYSKSVGITGNTGPRNRLANPELEMAVRKEINIYDREIWLRDVWNITGLSVVGIKGNLEALGELKT